MDMKNMCGKCPDRSICTELCSKAKAYADQDYRGRDELPFQEPWDEEPWSNMREDPRELSKMQAVELLNEGKSRRAVAGEMGIPRETVRRWLT